MSVQTSGQVCLIAALSLATASCGVENSSDPGQPSPGDTWSDGPNWSAGQEWRLSDSAIVVIGDGRNSDHELSRVVRAMQVPDGYLVVNGRPPQVRLFDRDGLHKRTEGRAGEGPGEYRLIFGAWMASSDSLILYDPGVGRLTYLGGDGSLLGTVAFGGPGAPIANVLLGRFSDGSFLAMPNRSPRPEEGEGLVETQTPVLRVSADLARIDTLTQSTGGRHFLLHPEEGMLGWRAQPFSPMTAVAAGSTTVFVSNTADFWIQEFDLDGGPLRRFGRAFEPEAVTAEDWTRLREAQESRIRESLERSGNPEQVSLDNELRLIDQFYRDMPRPAVKPAHARQLILDSGGHLWVRENPRLGEGPAWSVFAPDGRFLGTVIGDERLRVTEIGIDYVLGVWTDELGVESVRAFGLVKPTE